MQYEELVELMSRLDARRLTLSVHPDDFVEVREAVRQIGDEALRRGSLILAPRIVESVLVEPGQILIMQPREESDGG